MVRAIAIAAMVSALASPVCAETITKERFGCRSKETSERLFKLIAVKDTEAFEKVLSIGLAVGDCKIWDVGDTVRIEERTMGLACMAQRGSTERCYWTSVNAID